MVVRLATQPGLMYEEFLFPYEKPLIEGCGLNCCDCLSGTEQ